MTITHQEIGERLKDARMSVQLSQEAAATAETVCFSEA